MESLDTEVVEDMEKRDSRGRRLISKEQWSELLSAYDSSGLTQRNFCRREGLNFNSFVYQLSRRREKALPKEAPTTKFCQLQLSSRSIPTRWLILRVRMAHVVFWGSY